MITLRRVAPAAPLAAALLVAAAPLASAATAPSLLRTKDLGSGWTATAAKTSPSSGRIASCHTRNLGKGDPITVVTFRKGSIADRTYLTESVLTAKDAAHAAALFQQYRSIAGSCPRAFVSSSHTVKGRKATPAKVSGTDGSFGVTETVSGTTVASGITNVASGTVRANVYLTGNHIVLLLESEVAQSRTGDTITVRYLDGTGARHVLATASKAAVKRL